MNKTFKKALSLVLVLMMVVSTMVIVPLTASAEEAALGTKANPIKVGTAEEFKALDVTLKDAEDNLTSPITSATNDPVTGQIYVVLTADIDLGGAATNIKVSGFTLNIDGQNHTVSNYTGSGSNPGLFGAMSSKCTVQNLHVAGATITGATSNSGLIVSHAYHSFQMINCSAAADCSITSTSNHVGGLIGGIAHDYATSNTTAIFRDCVNNATVSGAAQVGGLVGNLWYTGNSAIFENCVNNGTVTGTGSFVGGILGKAENVIATTVLNCKNTGTVSSSVNSKFVGGMVGQIAKGDFTATNCLNAGKLSSAGKAGGVLGQGNVGTTFTFTNCANTAEISADCPAGIAAQMMYDPTVTFINCYNGGKMAGWGWQSGGILAYASTSTAKKLTFVNCVNDGAVVSNYTAGGIMGYSYGAYDIEMKNCANLGLLNAKSTGQISDASYGAIGGMIAVAYSNKAGLPVDLSFDNCYSTGEFTMPNNVDKAESTHRGIGGMLGEFNATVAGNTATFNKCFATGAVTKNDAYTYGAMLGVATANNVTVTATNCDASAAEAGIAAINAAIYTPDVTELEIRLKLTDDFGFLAADEMWAGADEAGFVFSTEAITTDNVASLAKTAGAAYGAKTYATYTGLSAAELGTTVYFAAYVTVDGVTYYSAARSINCAELAEDLIDGYYGDAATGVLVTESAKEMALYAAMCDYYAAYVKYLDSVTPA